MAFELINKNTREPLWVDKVSIEAECIGPVAGVTIEVHFCQPPSSPTSGNVEAELKFTLPGERAAICGFQTDVYGAMVDGVITSKETAQVALEAAVCVCVCLIVPELCALIMPSPSTTFKVKKVNKKLEGDVRSVMEIVESIRTLNSPYSHQIHETHEITKINDALLLWEKIKRDKVKIEWRPDAEEEYEDVDGNVFNKKLYEDLVRQGVIQRS
ncbi:hypothetical protein Pelo_1827 [Pelomyxa schiedti]|nr:hypothetical protein Pelo_1827 [Pelomyxa schiedti]